MELNTKAAVIAFALVGWNDSYFEGEPVNGEKVNPDLFATRSDFDARLASLTDSEFDAIDDELMSYWSENDARYLVGLYLAGTPYRLIL